MKSKLTIFNVLTSLRLFSDDLYHFEEDIDSYSLFDSRIRVRDVVMGSGRFGIVGRLNLLYLTSTSTKLSSFTGS